MVLNTMYSMLCLIYTVVFVSNVFIRSTQFCIPNPIHPTLG